MRILMLTQFYPPIIGGEEQHVRNLGGALVARGHHVSVATVHSPGTPEFDVDNGVRVYRIRGTMQRVERLFTDAGRAFAPPFPDPEFVRSLCRVIATERPEIVHAHNWLIHSFLPLKAWSKAKLVLTLHDYGLICAKKRLMYDGAPCSGPAPIKCLRCSANFYGPLKGVPTLLANAADGIIERRMVDKFLPVSRAVAIGNRLDDSHLPYEIIPNFVPDDIDQLRGDVEPYLAQLPEGEYILFVGDLSIDKGIETLLRAYATLSGSPPLVCIGRRHPETPTELPDNVRILEHWPHDAVMWAWSRCQIAIIPSIVPDSCPTVAMEAMALGKPIVASRTGGLPDIVRDNETGLLVTPSSVEDLRAALATLLADHSLRQRMGGAGRERVKHFQAGAVVQRIEAVYRSLLGRAPVVQSDTCEYSAGAIR